VPIYNIESFTNNQFVTVEITTVTNEPFSPFGQVKTNTIRRTYGTNIIAGDFFILPTNACSVNILGLQATMPYQWTNSFLSLTNASADTNNAGWTNVFLYTEQQMMWSTNRAFVINPVVCDTNSVANRLGIEKVSFLRRDYDSTVNRFFYPITNTYALTVITNWGSFQQTVQRYVSTPDILFDAADLGTGPTSWPIINPTVSREEPHFVTATTGGGTNLYGPGTIEPPVSFTFNKVGPLFLNTGPFFLDEKSSDLDFIWASFDGSTNPPVIYPQTMKLWQYTNQVFMYVANQNLPQAKAGQPYQVQLIAGGSGAGPYTWELAPQSPALPVGINLETDGEILATAPAALQPGIYDFVVRLTDAESKHVDTELTLIIQPWTRE
jgi:hypothetical protein